jgi:hypothetical protein
MLANKNKISGDYAEFGCNGAMTFVLAHQNLRKFSDKRFPGHMWAFDSFEGLPAPKDQKDQHPSWRAGALKTTEDDFRAILRGSDVPDSAYTMVRGYYSDTIGRDAANRPATLPDDIALAYIDCDLYSSTVSVMEFLQPRMKHGMVLACDDYFLCSSTAAAGERLALMESMGRELQQFCLVPFVQFGYGGMSFVVEDRKYLGVPPETSVAP